MTAGAINDRFDHSWPTTTRHLGVLRDAGLVEVEERGRQRLYRLERARFAQAVGWLRSWVEDERDPPEGEWADLSWPILRNALPPESEGEA